ncbi:TonB-dependent siderophore receptor [Flavobacterium columnare]|uniref:TonB-dependent receptor n=1 Tax=Flavobacterium columnare TaxID=996 RepID=A0AAI8GBQ2_9FLAO|nr:TonB-dependent receptor [Flavobacterium columnare]AMO21201.1 TonB-dependent receptor [Flavobacterium columnare]AUX19214.1 TonB-dependent receptor [Flavobacterium columnare]QOG58301.1 TonB-dependent receptor [Flavobacterium columnare]QOG61024.1 TonB-dependent receptor [Flavobacterium columnare]QOG63744.1 TonB-dependent receptor [Flavobacterium columnare]
MKLYWLGCLLFLSGQSFGQDRFQGETENTVENDTARKKRYSLKEIEIRQHKQKKFVSTVRTGLKPFDNPQSLESIGGEVIYQQQSVRLSDVVKNANGVYVGSARGGAQESFWSRGYDMGTNNIFKNGFRQNGGSMPEVISLEKVEFLKGNSALLYGNVAPGGILNLVTKTPLFERGGELSFQTGSYDFYKPVIDFYGPLSKSIAYRVVSSFEKSKSFRDVVSRERYYINPSFLFKATQKTDVLLQMDYLYDNWTPDFGTGAFGKTILDVPISRYLGANWSNGQTRQGSLSALLKHQINDSWKFIANMSFQNYSRQFEGTDRIQPSNITGDLTRKLGKNKNVETLLGQQLGLQGSFKTFGFKHELFTGVDGETSYTDSYSYLFYTKQKDGKFIAITDYDKINIFDPITFSNEKGSQENYNSVLTKNQGKRFGFFAQDLISIHEKLKVLAGLRWSWQEVQSTVYNAKIDGGNTTSPKGQTPFVLNHEADKDNAPIEGAIQVDKAFSPKFGLVFQPMQSIAIFGSYSNSFTTNTGVDIYNDPIKPSIINQYEAGVKTEFFKGNLTTGVTVYSIENNNLVQMAATTLDGKANSNSNIKELSGKTRSKGIELDITVTPIEGFKINAGYSYNDMRFVKTSGLVGSSLEGDRLARTPDQTANLSFFYTVQNGFFKNVSIGAITNYIGNRIGGWNNRYAKDKNGTVFIEEREIPVSGYAVADATLGYTYKNISLLCKLSNVANTLNYTVHENYSINPIPPRQFMATLKYQF